MQLPLDPDRVKGFLHPDEGECLYRLAYSAAALGPALEVGSYCGKSTLYLGAGVRDGGGLLYALDHHRGSEEHQLGEEYHDAELYDVQLQQMDSLPTFRRTLALAQLESVVVPIVASSAQAGRYWQTRLRWCLLMAVTVSRRLLQIIVLGCRISYLVATWLFMTFFLIRLMAVKHPMKFTSWPWRQDYLRVLKCVEP